MFKTDKVSLEELSFAFDARDIANFRAVLEHLKSSKLLTLPEKEVQRVLVGLDEIGRLKLDRKVYGFHVFDSFAEEQGNGYGVELYIRQGDRLEYFCVPPTRDEVYSVSDIVELLKEHSRKTKEIYTGNFPANGIFLGLHETVDRDNPIERDILEEMK